MNDVLERHGYDDRAVELRRLVGIAASLIVLSGLWHGLRGPLIRGCASASVGCYGRDDIVRAGLRRAGYGVSNTDQLRAHSLPRPGWVAWSSMLEHETLPDRSQRAKRWQTTVVDGRLRLLGKLPTCYMNDPPMDIDGDGHWEAMVGIIASQADDAQPTLYDAVVRMGPKTNELIWLGLFDDSSWRARGIRVSTKWQDTDGDGMYELVFITVVTARGPSGGIVFKPPEIVAAFAMDRAGGILRPRLLPDDCGLTPWSPPSDAPIPLDQTAELEAVFRKLLPVPDLADE